MVPGLRGRGEFPGHEVRSLLRVQRVSIHWSFCLDIPVPSDDELDQVLPAGDLSIFADLGLDEMKLGAVSADLDLYPEGRARVRQDAVRELDQQRTDAERARAFTTCPRRPSAAASFGQSDAG